MAEVESSKKRKYKTHFTSDYTKAYPCLIRVKNNDSYARCTICNSDINIANGGLNDCKRHVECCWIRPGGAWSGNKTNHAREKLRAFKPCTPEVSYLRILVHGPVGGGKSSFINSIDSVFQERITSGALAEAATGRSFTKAFQTHYIKNKSYGTFVPFSFCDIMGLEDGHSEGLQPKDLIKVLQGHIRDGYRFNPTSPCSENSPHYNRNPELNDRIHCLVSVIPANRISMMDDDVIDKMKTVRAQAGGLRIPQLVILTKVDEACLMVCEDIKHIYRSKKIREKMQECNNKLGVPINCIFPVKCYHEEIDLNNDVDMLLLSALTFILNFANDHAEVMASAPAMAVRRPLLPSPPPSPSLPPYQVVPHSSMMVQPQYSPKTADWVMEPDPAKAAQLFRTALQKKQHQEPLTLTLSLLESVQDRHRQIFSFYKTERMNWAGPLTCTLTGDPAVGDGVKHHVLSTVMEALQSGFLLEEKKGKRLLFEGERDHLTPNTSLEHLENHLFVIAGRIIGHSFLNGGPCLTGLSPAIIHILLEDSPETATISLSDCVDQEVRDVLTLLEGTKPLTEDEKSAVNNVGLPWDLPCVTSDSRQWLRDKILLHAVLGRTKKQVKHLRRGLKDTSVWKLLSSRPDTAAVLFPRASDSTITPQMILDKIVWPSNDEDVYQELYDMEDITLEDQCRVLNYLRDFIEKGTPEVLRSLVVFWSGWEVLSSHLAVVVTNCSLPQSATCFQLLKLPKRTQTFEEFCRDITASISSSEFGFGEI